MSQPCFRALGQVAALCALIGLCQRQTLAEERRVPEQRSVTLQTDLITPFFTTYYLESNLRLSDHVGLLFNTSYLFLRDEDWKTKTGTLGVGASYYFEGHAPGRWYAEAVGEANFSYWFHRPSGERAPLKVGETGVLLGGYRFISNDGPVLDLAAGLVVVHLRGASIHTGGNTLSTQGFTRVYPAAKLSVGWAF